MALRVGLQLTKEPNMPYKVIGLPENANPQQVVPHPMQQMSQQAMQMQGQLPQAQMLQQPIQQQDQIRRFPLYTSRAKTNESKYKIIGLPEGYTKPEDEGIGTKIARTIGGSIARLGTGAVSEPGNIQSTLEGAQGLIGGETETQGLKFPTSSDTNQWLDKVTGNLLKPKGNIEETIQNIAGDIGGYLPWLFFGPVGGVLGGLKNAAKVATGANVLGQGVKMMEGGPTAQAIAKIGGGLAMGLRGTRQAAKELHKTSYSNAEKLLPKTATHNATQVETIAHEVKKNANKYNLNSKNYINDEVGALRDLIKEEPKFNKINVTRVKDSILTKIKDDSIPYSAKSDAREIVNKVDKLLADEALTAPQIKSFRDDLGYKLSTGDVPVSLRGEVKRLLHDIDTEKVMNVSDAWGFKKALNEKLLSKNVPDDARQSIGKLIGSINENILGAYGQKNLAFGKHFARAEDLHRGLKEASKITQFFVKHTNLENFVKKSPVLKTLLGVSAYHGGFTTPALAGLAVGGATAISARELSRFKDLITNSKEARKLWTNILKGAAQNNLALVTSSLERLDNLSGQTNQ